MGSQNNQRVVSIPKKVVFIPHCQDPKRGTHRHDIHTYTHACDRSRAAPRSRGRSKSSEFTMCGQQYGKIDVPPQTLHRQAQRSAPRLVNVPLASKWKATRPARPLSCRAHRHLSLIQAAWMRKATSRSISFVGPKKNSGGERAHRIANVGLF